MNEIIDEKTYPIQLIWLFKSTAGLFLFFPLLAAYIVLVYRQFDLIYFIIFLAALVISIVERFVLLLLKRANFHYIIKDNELYLKQGIFSKKEMHTPYSTIQSIFIKQAIFDRIFGLATLSIENLAQGDSVYTDRRREFMGFYGNKTFVPGLKKEHAEALRATLLERMKENPSSDTASGL